MIEWLRSVVRRLATGSSARILPRTGDGGHHLLDSPATLKVGLYAINTSSDPLTVRFEDFDLSEGKASGTRWGR
jgi:hypothetical protein